MFSKVKIFELPNFQRALLKDLRNVWEQQSVWWPLHCWAQKVSCTSKYYFIHLEIQVCHWHWGCRTCLCLCRGRCREDEGLAKLKNSSNCFSPEFLTNISVEIIFLGHMCQTSTKSLWIQVSSNIFLSLHTVGTSYKHWVTFNQQEDMKEVMLMILVNILTISLSIKVVNRAVFLHVALPGQRPGAPDLESFPRWNIIFVTLSWTPVMS